MGWRGDVMPAGAVQDAARAAALEVLRELQQQGSLGNVVSTSPDAGTPNAGAAGSNGASRAGMIGAPKGYKGAPSDSRADAFRKMQVGAWCAKLMCMHAVLASMLLMSCGFIASLPCPDLSQSVQPSDTPHPLSRAPDCLGPLMVNIPAVPFMSHKPLGWSLHAGASEASGGG